ncbi:TPA: class I SAM-dependent methyltransferase [bacterium]|nr:class I SAM-dependent methyltransferase [bacterium]
MTLGQHWSYNLYNDPKRLVFVLSRYKFSAKIGAKDRRILELGCSEGIGVPILSEFAKSYTGVDMDRDAIETARKNFGSDSVIFIIVSFDVIEHILPKNVSLFFHKIVNFLTPYGIAIIGTPNITSQQHASPVTKAGHVNIYSWERLEYEMRQYFVHVFMFGANDEVIHTGFLPMAHYLIGLGCRKK